MKASVEISSKLLKEFDKILHDRGYESRSKGIRDAINDYILRYQWMNEIEGEKVGIITVIYDHHFVGAKEDLTNTQHDYREYIDATMHVPINENQYLGIIVVESDANNIREFIEKIRGLKGMEHVKLTSTGINKYR
ncbi:MAG: ribbon-helix-helix protein, CopG family [Methanobacterium formicicum]